MAVYLAKGTRDFLPADMHKQNHMVRILEQQFHRFGFEPLMTPAFERIETLTGKYGDEGQQLMFKILKRGKGEKTGQVDQALRYDLTVPLARVVAMNQDLRMPFKRYQIAPVWRADRPAKGRFREFVQCDADIVGTTSPLADAECLAWAASALTALGIEAFTLRINDRRILRGMVRRIDALEQETPILVAIDKLDKIGKSGVAKELSKLGLSDDAIETLWQALEPQDGVDATLDFASQLFAEDPEALEAVETLRQVVSNAIAMGTHPDRLAIDLTLARGLSYYTGPVFEGRADGIDIGSICGGGRYDGLVGMFSGKDIPAVGIAIGLARIQVVLEELGLLEQVAQTSASVLIARFDDRCNAAAMKAATALRAAGIDTDLFLGTQKLRNQFRYANAKGYPWIATIGPDEANNGTVALKNLTTGEQDTLTLDMAIDRITST